MKKIKDKGRSFSKRNAGSRKEAMMSPIFVLHTPGGELAKRMRMKEAQNNQGRRIRFKIVEKGGITLEQLLRRSNPRAGEGCERPKCFPCSSGGGGNCWREAITYLLWCEECGIKVAAYKGESGRNGFRQGEEHLDNKATKDEEKSILWAHSVHHHDSREDMVYMMRVTGAYNEPLDRQIMERVQISNFQGPVLMNRRIDKMRYRRWGGD